MNIILFSKENDQYNPERSEYIFSRNDDRYHHLKKILKLSRGDFFKAGIINGKIGIAEIKDFSKEKIVFSFEEKRDSLALPKIKLLIGFPRPIQLKRILRDIASLGCYEIFLCGTELGENSYLKSSLSEKSQIEKCLIAGISQASQTLLPKFSLHNSLKSGLQKIESAKISRKILLDIDENAPSLAKVDFDSEEEIILAIGSERGWTNKERELFLKHSFQIASLGKRILRTETAITAALAIMLARNW